jgi:hypothetical protein
MEKHKIQAEQNRILEIRAGSHLFGTSTPDSDLDLVGIYMPSEEMLFGLSPKEEVDLSVQVKDDTGRNTKDSVDRKLHEYRKFVKLAIQNNPNIVHVLFVDELNTVFINDFGKTLLDHAHLFPTRGAYYRFIAYADGQLRKMRIKPENYAKLERGLEILESTDDNMVMAEMKDTKPFWYKGKGKHVRLGDINFEAGVFVKKARRMVRERLSRVTNRVELFTKFGYDTKFASNLIQLSMEGIELMKTGRIEFPLSYADEILDVKKGVYNASFIEKWAEDLKAAALDAFEHSKLPDAIGPEKIHPRFNEIEAMVIQEVSRF